MVAVRGGPQAAANSAFHPVSQGQRLGGRRTFFLAEVERRAGIWMSLRPMVPLRAVLRSVPASVDGVFDSRVHRDSDRHFRPGSVGRCDDRLAIERAVGAQQHQSERGTWTRNAADRSPAARQGQNSGCLRKRSLVCGLRTAPNFQRSVLKQATLSSGRKDRPLHIDTK